MWVMLEWQKLKTAGFETFGADVKRSTEGARHRTKSLAEKVNLDTRYLANVENGARSLTPRVIIQLVKILRSADGDISIQGHARKKASCAGVGKTHLALSLAVRALTWDTP